MTKTKPTSIETGLEIAVIGMAGRFPGAKNIHEFWENIKNGVESITFFSNEEFAAAGIKGEMIDDPNYVKARGVLEDKEYFDAAFFGYTPIEAEVMDLQVRVFHECCWHALENAGYDPFSYNRLIGLYGGASPDFQWEAMCLLSGKTNLLGSFAAALLRRDYLCAKTSYKLSLTGPSVFMYTACSTSLVAVHMACQGLLSGECDMSLAGGVTVIPRPNIGYLYQEGMIGSPDGHCRTFDAMAGGTAGGEGIGVVVLKRFKEAAADRDYIYAVIKGSAINNDGDRKVGFTAPSIKGQAEAICTALQMAEVNAESISYIEAHGTGTTLGDPVEINALKKVFKTNKQNSCGIGSVKTNVGHLDSAAGAAGFIKTVLALKHRLIPPNLHFETPNPEIDFEGSPFYVNRELSQWKNENYPLRAGVSSFGIGGTNAHVVLEEAPSPEPSSAGREFQLLVLSAKKASALDRMTRDLAEYLKKKPDISLADAAYTLQMGRKAFPYRRMFVCATIPRAIDALTSGDPGSIKTSFSKDADRPVIFMFPGQGSQYVNMGLDLYKTEAVFRQEMDMCFEILKPIMGYDIKEILYPGDLVSKVSKVSKVSGVSEESPPVSNQSDRFNRSDTSNTSYNSYKSHINRTEIAQPVLFAFEYALAKLLMKWGIKPYAMIGHSIGEYVAACLSGAFSLEDALGLVAARGRLMQKVPPGAMLSVPLSPEALTPFLNEELAIAAVNTTSRSVVSGSHQAIDDLAGQLKEKEYEISRLYTSHAFHSPMMDPVLEEFSEKVKKIRFKKPGIPYISNVTGKWITVNEAADPEYWVKHLRRTVYFADGLSLLLKKEDSIFVEIGPGKILSSFVRQHQEKKPGQFPVNLARSPKENVADHYYLLSKVGQLWSSGLRISWEGFYERENRNRIPLPTYSFERTLYPAPGNFHKMTARMLSKNPVSPDEKAAIDENGIPEAEIEKESSSSGKMNRPELSTGYAAPRDQVEQTVVEVFQQFFGIEPIGIYDDFYELGGDSLSAVQLAALIRKSNIDITFRQLLLEQNIHEICRNLNRQKKPGADIPIDTAIIEHYLSGKYKTDVYYRTCQVGDTSYRILFIVHEPIGIQRVLEDMETMAVSTSGTVIYPNFITFIEPGHQVPEPGNINNETLTKLLQLKDRISKAEHARLLEELALNNRFSHLLKKNTRTREYEASPVQKRHLLSPDRIRLNFIYYSHDFSHPLDIEKIKNIVTALIEKNSLLRSVIAGTPGNYFIREFDSFPGIRVPFIDISGYSTACKKEINRIIMQHLLQPMNVLDNILFKALVLKVDHSCHKLMMLFNHLIFDGTSIVILEEQVRKLIQGAGESQERKPSIKDYRDYVYFLKAQNYENVQVEKYLPPPDYIHAIETVSKNYNVRDEKIEDFHLDISIINEAFKDYYEEIVLLTYAKLICRLFEVEKVPIAFTSHGRVYKDGRFNQVIGDFPDIIPVLFSFDEGKDSEGMMDHFINYKRFIRENNFNFFNYVSKGYLADLEDVKLISPFTFNSLMGSYDFFKRTRAEDLNIDMGDIDARREKRLEPHFYLGMLEDYYTHKLGIRFSQNSGFSIKEIFIENYHELVHDLNKKDIEG